MAAVYKKIGKSSLAWRLVITVVLFSSIITLGITVFQLYVDYKHDIKEIDDDLRLVETSYLESLSQSVWAYDDRQITSQLEGILGLPGMVYVEIQNNGKKIASAGNKLSKNIIEKQYSLVHRHKNKDKLIGTLIVINNLNRVYKRLMDKAITIFLSNAFKTFLVSGFILYIFHILVTKKLVQLAKRVEVFDIDEDVSPIILEDVSKWDKKNDELNQVATEINRMRANIQKAYIKLKESAKQHQLILQTAMDGFWLADMQGSLMEVNETYCRMSGYTAQELISMNISDLEAVENKEKVSIHIQKTLTQGQDRFETQHCRKDGTLFDVEVSVQYQPFEQGRFVFFLRDITEYKQTAEMLRQKNRTLLASNAELEIFNRAMVDRELHMIEMKEEIDTLCRRLGETPRYGNKEDATDTEVK